MKKTRDGCEVIMDTDMRLKQKRMKSLPSLQKPTKEATSVFYQQPSIFGANCRSNLLQTIIELDNSLGCNKQFDATEK